MSPEEEETLLFPSSFVFPESFPAQADTPASGGEQKKAGRQRRRRKARLSAAAGDGAAGDDAAKKRRLSDEQAQFLELSFMKDSKLETTRKLQLAAELGLDTKQVAVWFQNRRARHKCKRMEVEYNKLRAAHDAVVVHNCHLEAEVQYRLLRLKARLAEADEEKKLMAASAAATNGCGGGGGGGGSSSPSSSSFSTVTQLMGQFGMEEAADQADLTYMSEYDYNSYMMDLAGSSYLGGVYDQFS
ncbi:hypothetical protein BRADI_1g71280v3 [Brachypodium distachyon]|uniref:Homeobox-leucine zipper protein n=1 Tax=Brachypodium distachyon TaxID=15368 RepID=I1H8J5_BRADI|nr:hypothetical protein BRADI_1g71280v3 [Brachypodium distachyon]